MYLTYDEFVGIGGSMNEASYARLEHKARAMLDLMTFGRVTSEDPARPAVKFAVFELIQAMADAEESSGIAAAEVIAVSNDGVSISYASGQSAESRYRQIVRGWLGPETAADGTPLLYKGVRVV